MIKKHFLFIATIFTYLAIFSTSIYAKEPDADTNSKINQKLKLISQFIDQQEPPPSFQEVFVFTVKSFLGTPYEGYGHDPIQTESLEVNVDKVGCVSLMELSLALARVAYCGQHSHNAVYSEIQRMRYRQGEVKGFTSRLHYFSEWLDQAEYQGVVYDLTMSLGGIELQRDFNFMTSRPYLYPPLSIDSNRIHLRRIEQELSKRSYPFMPKENVEKIENELKNGDLVAIVTDKPGIIISHVAMVTYVNNIPHLTHASSTLKQVVTSKNTISQYLNNQEKRQGIRITRVLPPICQLL